MANTQIRSVRSTVAVDDADQYEIVTTCIAKGDLPDKSIFLLNITDIDDPKSDTLNRVIGISDVSTYLNDRTAAITAGASQWRSTELRLVYTDIEAANAAQKELSSRINQLVNDFDLNNEEFETLSEVIVYPTVDASLKTDLENQYVVARDAANDAEETRDDRVTECTNVETEISVIQERLDEANSDLASITAVKGKLDIVNLGYPPTTTTISTNNELAKAKVDTSGASSSERDEIKVPLNSNTDYLATQTSLGTQLEAAVNGPADSVSSILSTIQARVASLAADLTSKNTTLTACNTKLAQAQGALDAARAAEDAALAAVVAICPDFDPNTV